MTDKNPIPRHLKGGARALWRRLREDYGIDDASGLALLEAACSSYQRAEEARRQVEREGSTVKDRFEQVRAHPSVGIERDARNAMVAALKALRLAPSEEV